MHDLLEFRYEPEPGYGPSKEAFDEPKPGSLGHEVLREDLGSKKLDAIHKAPVVGFPRCQTSVSQICDLNAIPSNNLWILLEDDYAKDANEYPVGAVGDLPIPGFTCIEKYPSGFRIPRGFMKKSPQEALPPRCEHSYLHTLFADHCNRCFPNGQHDDCGECEAHDAIRMIKDDQRYEGVYEAALLSQDRDQFALARKADDDQRAWVAYHRRNARVFNYFSIIGARLYRLSVFLSLSV
jgi:hypothetical protein